MTQITSIILFLFLFFFFSSKDFSLQTWAALPFAWFSVFELRKLMGRL